MRSAYLISSNLSTKIEDLTEVINPSEDTCKSVVFGLVDPKN